MKEWLWKWLGCSDKVLSLEVQLEAWRARAIAAEANVELLKEMLKVTKAPTSTEHREAPSFEPIRPQFGSWPRMRRKLEEMERVKNAQVSREEIEKTIR
jgi:hypothetical protein